MPMLSLHNTYSMPTGSASYTLGLSGAPNVSSYSYQTSAGAAAASGLLGTGIGATSSGISNLIGTSGLSGLSSHVNPLTGAGSALHGGYASGAAGNSYSTYTNPLLSVGVGATSALKLKTYDDLDLLGRYGNRATTPNSPIPPASWSLDAYGLDGVNPTFMHTQRSLSRLGGLDLDGEFIYIQHESIGFLLLLLCFPCVFFVVVSWFTPIAILLICDWYVCVCDWARTMASRPRAHTSALNAGVYTVHTRGSMFILQYYWLASIIRCVSIVYQHGLLSRYPLRCVR